MSILAQSAEKIKISQTKSTLMILKTRRYIILGIFVLKIFKFCVKFKKY